MRFRRWLGGLALSALTSAGCLGSCGGDPQLAEKKTDQWRAVVRCESARNVLPPGGGLGRQAAFSARVVFLVEGVGERRARTVVPGGMMDDDDQTKLDASCRRLRATIETRESADGTVFAASLEGQQESSVILRAPNGAVFASPLRHPGEASRAAQTHPAPLSAAIAMITDGTLRDAAGSAVFDAIDDAVVRANQQVFLRASEQCNAPTWLVERLVRLAPDETARRLFEPTYVRGSCSRSRLALEGPPTDVVAPLVRAWIEARAQSAEPWPAGIERYAEEHSITLGPRGADGGADSATATATGVDSGVRR